MMTIFITGDHHFGHKNILKYCPNRHFSTIEEHDETLIARWNERVKPNDYIIHVGDFGFNVEYNIRILSRLRGKKILISGNHDENNLRSEDFRSHWKEIHIVYHEVKVVYGLDTARIVLCHYPLHSWNGSFHGAFHVHGHVHSTPDNPKMPRMRHRKDVGVDSREDCAPWEKDELLTLMTEERS